MFGRRKRQTQPEDEPIFTDELKLNVTDEQRMICGENEACIFDLVITEDMNVAVATLGHEEDAMETLEVISMCTRPYRIISYSLPLVKVRTWHGVE